MHPSCIFTHQSRRGATVIDCQRSNDLQTLAEFWYDALGLSLSPDQPDDRYAALTGLAGEVRVIAQRFKHAPRVHLDIKTDNETDNKEAKAHRLIALSANPAGKANRRYSSGGGLTHGRFAARG